MTHLLAPGRLVCPNNCGAVAPNVTNVAAGSGSSTMHDCPTLAGLSVPLVPEGTRAEARAHEREDYLNGELVRYDANGRPMMSVTVERDTGNDCVVFAPTATAGAEASL